MRILDLGCGNKKVRGAIGVDIEKKSQADVICDLEEYSLPFENDSFDIIYARHVLEHIGDILSLMKEIHRIGKPNASLFIETPHFSSYSSFTDFTHKHHLGIRSFDPFDPTLHPENIGKYPSFRIVRRRIVFDLFFKRLKIGRFKGIPIYKLTGIEFLANLFVDAYERFFCFVFPSGGTDIYLELKIIKQTGGQAVKNIP